jgi:16S rRNA (uracil1498-N3)-methyltransferase
MEPGDPLEVLDGAGRTYSCRVVQADKRSVVAEVKVVHLQQEPLPIGLAPCLLKGRAMDLLIQKATELGATFIQPLISARTVVQFQERDLENRRSGWELTAREACKQCGNAWLPRIELPRTLPEYLACHDGSSRVAAMLSAEAALPGEAWERFAPGPGGVVLLTGPEGDFTFDEQEELLAAGVTPITLGPRVLRAETAAIAGLAILQHEWTQRSRNNPSSEVASPE